jgi:hypothetical protein
MYLVVELVLCNPVDCFSNRQEFKTPDVFHVSLPGLLLKNDFFFSRNNWESLGKSAISKNNVVGKKTVRFQGFPPPPTRSVEKKVLMLPISLLHEF